MTLADPKEKRAIHWEKGTLVGRIAISVLAVLALVLVSSTIAVIASFHSRSVVQILHQSLGSTRAAEELEISLLEQRGVVAAYMLDGGNKRRLEDLTKAQEAFNLWLRKSRELASDSTQRKLLDELESLYERYLNKRNKVVELYDAGETREATELLLNDVNQLYSEAYVVCEEIISNNEELVDQAKSFADRATLVEFWLMIGAVAISVLLTGVLLQSLYFGILRPLRSMIQDARSFQLESSGLTLQSPDDELRALGFYLQRMMTDVTVARTTLIEHSERLRQSESLASVGKLASCVAHEIRNPLTAINMWLYSAEQSIATRSHLKDMISKARNETNRLEQVVQHFLEFAKPPDLNRTSTNLREIVGRSLELLRPAITEKEVEIQPQFSDNDPCISADANQLTQVITNLLMNAIDASNSGQIIQVQMEQCDAMDAKWQVVRVTDFGGGINEETRERIFEPFFTTKTDGTGLGLCIAANIMARHRGRLVLECSDKNGTVFSLWLPMDGI